MRTKKNQKQKISRVSSTKTKTEKEKKISQQSPAGLDFYRAFFEYAPDAFYVHDLQGRLLDGNRAAEKLTGFTKKEFCGKNFYELGLVDERYLPLIQSSLKKNNQGEMTGPDEIEIRMKKGKKAYAEVRDFPINVGGEKLVLGIAHDITEKKQAEWQLIASEKRYRNLLDNLLEGGQLISRDFRYLYINDVAAKHGRKTKKQLLGKTMMELYPNIEKTEMFAMIKKCLKQKTSIKMENEFIFPDGKKGFFQLRMEPTDEGVFILSSDVTQKKQAEEKLARSEDLYRRIFESSPEMIILINGKGQILEMNNRLKDWGGYDDATEFIGGNVFKVPFISPNSVGVIKQNFTRRLKGEDIQPYEIELLKKNGDIGIGLVRGALITGQNGEIIGDLVLVSDMTVLKEKEDQVKRKIAELEKLNKLMIGREIKMVELKKSLKNLQKNNHE